MSQPKLIDLAGGGYLPAVALVDALGNSYVAGAAGPSTSIVTSVTAAAADTAILAANALRKGATFYNSSTSIMYLLLSTGVSSVTNYSVQVPASGTFTIPTNGYSGVVRAIWSAVNGAVLVTEFA